MTGAAQGNGAAGGTASHDTVTQLGWTAAIVLLPLVPVLFVGPVLDRIIEAGLIDFNFLSSEGLTVPPPLTSIPAKVVSGLYYFGFAYTAAVTLALALGVFAISVWTRSAQPMTHVARIISAFPFAIIAFILLLNGSVSAKSWSGWPIIEEYSVGGLLFVARMMVNNSLSLLPECGLAAAVDCSFSIGNTGSSVKDILGLPTLLLAVAGLFYLAAVAALVGSSLMPGGRGIEAAKAASLVRLLTITAALTFVASVLAVQLLFVPGRAVIEAAYSDVGSEFARQVAMPAALARYDALSGAMVAYWGAVFSMALAATYFPASMALARDSGGDLAGAWSVARALATTLLPLIGTGVAAVLQAVIERVPAAGG